MKLAVAGDTGATERVSSKVNPAGPLPLRRSVAIATSSVASTMISAGRPSATSRLPVGVRKLTVGTARSATGNVVCALSPRFPATSMANARSSTRSMDVAPAGTVNANDVATAFFAGDNRSLVGAAEHTRDLEAHGGELAWIVGLHDYGDVLARPDALSGGYAGDLDGGSDVVEDPHDDRRGRCDLQLAVDR